MSLSKNKIKPLIYEVLVKIQCPHCVLEDKEIFITMPARGLPECISCFNCGKTFVVKDLYTTGKELLRIAPKNEKIKGVLS